jgi:hypothetical protein
MAETARKEVARITFGNLLREMRKVKESKAQTASP